MKGSDRALRLLAMASLLALGLLALAGCPPDDDEGDTSADVADAADAAGDADATGALQWYLTCGDPVCSTHRDDPSVDKCTTETAGEACSAAGALCDPVNDCNSRLLCTDSDPTAQPGGCPISRRATKRDIAPLSDTDRAQIVEALRRMPLSTWRYVADEVQRPARLGFIIEDVAPSPAVDEAQGIVDLYGFTAMAVVGLQEQAREIETLRAELAAVREHLRRLEVPGPAPAPAGVQATDQGPGPD